MNKNLSIIHYKTATKNDLKIFGIIYLIRNKINGKVYIGKTINNFATRYATNTWYKEIDNILLKRSINKYGYKNFSITLLISGVKNVAYLTMLETYYIELFNSYVPNGFNLRSNENSLNNKNKCKFISLRDKNEKLLKITNINEFCRKNKLPRNCVRNLLNKIFFHYKGFHFPYLTLQECIKASKNCRTKNRLIFLKYKNGRIYTISNRTLFCKKYNIGRHGIIMLLTGKLYQYKGFSLLKTDINKIPIGGSKPFEIETINGEKIFIQNLRQFCKDNLLDYNCMKRLRAGDGNKYKEFINKNGKEHELGLGSERTYFFISPSEKKIKITNLAKFCKANYLSENQMRWLYAGRYKEYKGWKKDFKT